MVSLRRRFEDDPKFQTRFHKIGTYVWLVNMIVVPVVFATAPGVWNRFALFYTLWVSLYANFATDYDGVSSSEASGHALDAVEELEEDTKQ